MPRRQKNVSELLSYLRLRGPTLSSDLVSHFEISRPTLSRRLKELGNAVLTIGRGRATQLAARHEDWPAEVPVYQVSKSGQVGRFGQLHPVQWGTQTQWLLIAEKDHPALTHDEFKDGLFPGWPWFLEDLRPSGFLGRAFGKRMANLYQIKENPDDWTDLELLGTLVNFGSNLPGNFILGDANALRDYQRNRIQIAEGTYKNSSPSTYPQQAERALNEGEEYGSSAGGEQPKFTTIICDTPAADPCAVIVKFSPKLDTGVGQRWSDLLHAEHIANQLLRDAGFATASTRTFQIGGRAFLESERFDRVGASGRKGLVTLRALDAAYVGKGSGTWADAARKLFAGKWITEADRNRMIRLHCFGELIANTDMHWGNLSFYLPEAAPFPLAPVYDMLPMHFRPSSTGEVMDRPYEPKLPKPEDQAAWLEMHPLALRYWQQVQTSPDITSEFKLIATETIQALQHIHKIATSS